MNIFHGLNVRPITPKDAELLDKWRREYPDADLEIVHGFISDGVETAVAEKYGQLAMSLTAVQAVVFDPLIQNPNKILSGPEMITAITMMERVLAYKAQASGAVDGYVAVPNVLPEYQKMVMKCGYEPTVQYCTVYRRAFRPEVVARLGDERAEIVAKMKANTPPPVPVGLASAEGAMPPSEGPGVE